MEKELFGVMQGWQCPICKRVYSPYTSMCRYCGGNNYTTTTSSNLGGFVEEQSSDFRKKTTI
jgi:uncharacterized OB-fold protein